MMTLAAVALRISAFSNAAAHSRRESRIGLVMLMAAAALTVVLSFLMPRWAMFAYAINLLDGPALKLLQRRNEGVK
jgi:hypothetical protein